MQIAILKPWQWAHRAPRAVARETVELGRCIWRTRSTLWAVTRVDFMKKYAGSLLGVLWYPLYSALFLAVYSFVYLVVFPARYKDFGSYDYVLFIFAGLVPFMGFSDAVTAGAGSIKSNIALIKNTIFPAELIPIKHLMVAMMGMCISLFILLIMIGPTRHFGWHILYLPVPVLLLLTFTASVIWILSAVAVLVPDIMHLVNLLLLLLMFLSPIGYSLEMLRSVSSYAIYIAYANPMTNLTESFRFALLGIRDTPLWWDAIFGVLSLLCACVCGAFFRRLIPLFSDYE